MRFIFDSSPHHCPQHMCRGPRGEGRPSQSGGREDLRSERSAIEVCEVEVGRVSGLILVLGLI